MAEGDCFFQLALETPDMIEAIQEGQILPKHSLYELKVQICKETTASLMALKRQREATQVAGFANRPFKRVQ